jgi:hypothetical protein
MRKVLHCKPSRRVDVIRSSDILPPLERKPPSMPTKGTKVTSRKKRVSVKDIPAKKKRVGTKEMKKVKGGIVLCRTSQSGFILCKSSPGGVVLCKSGVILCKKG